jgi:hypothetical protein
VEEYSDDYQLIKKTTEDLDFKEAINKDLSAYLTNNKFSIYYRLMQTVLPLLIVTLVHLISFNMELI